MKKRLLRATLRDITIDGQRFIEVTNTTCRHNGAIPECGERDCHFFRRGECWINEYTKGTEKCRWPYIWQAVSKDGYILNREGHHDLDNIRIDAERYRIDANGKRYTYGTLWPSTKRYKYSERLIRYE